MSSNLNPTTIPEPTTLRSLQRYTSHQTELIESLLNPPFPNSHFRDSEDYGWVQFWSSAWGKDLDSFDKTEQVDRGPDPIDDPSLILPDVVPSNRDVMIKSQAMDRCWYFDCEKIFIRSEYKEAEEFALSTCCTAAAYDALVVTGQPGIGKSVFLLRVLLRRLALKLPTALQIEPNCAQLFYQEGVKEFTHLEDGPRYTPLESKCDLPGRIWALVDSNRQLVEPAPVFQQGPFFVAEASPPCRTRHEWTENIRSTFFYMKPWSFTEVLQVRSLLIPVASERKLLDFHHTYGASLECLFKFFQTPAHYERVVTEEVKKLSFSESYKVFQYAADTPDISDYLISTGPLPDDRTRPKRKVASKFALEQICARVIWGRVWG